MDDPLDFGANPSDSKSHHIQDDGESVQVRRVSLAEFTGLEEYEGRKKRPKQFIPLQQTITENAAKSLPVTSLIDAYSSRRRSTATCSLEDININISYKMSGSPGPIQELKHIGFHDFNEKVENLRKRLEKTMNTLPNQSPRKSIDSENEKAELLSESRKLAGACRTMVSAMTNEESRKKWPQIVDEVMDTADRVTSVTQRLIWKSNSVFQAQLMTAKTDQMLKSLLEVLQSLEELQQKSTDSLKRLTARSTTLTATINQLISAVRSV